ncbi:ShlB/FhaC/HecB family hemolysin secretion/activation protein [Acetonema longum]|uniref:Hemolysin activation translocator protein n=1 Tax=Acetonema longum DSM 6540 TaxID=1009370 RepID=F7NFH8_9FIRM|nr:ShlB/FhaC/HecB family hemolysin secretion/activation protein [Acetonema longum]EGO65233.1 hemolysin activation translocator protein [Acetonema longum DSM 6540]
MPISPFKTWLCIILPLFFLVFLSTQPSFAQTPSLSDREERLRRDRQEAAERKERQQRVDVFWQDTPSQEQDTSLPEESLMFPIRTILLEGDRVEKFPWVKDFLAPYHNRSMGRQGIQLIVKRLNNVFIDKGYITSRIFIPEQDLSGGTLRLLLVPGTIRTIRFSDSYAGNWHTAFPTGPGRLLNLRDIEQGLEQMKRIPSQDVTMQLVPGDQPGQSGILLTAKEAKPWKLVYSLDDSGSRSTGKLQSSFTFSYDNLWRINDLFHIAVNHDAEPDSARRGTKGNSIYYSFPYGNSTFTFTAGENSYHQTVAGSSQTFVSSGESENLDFKLSQLLSRDQTSKTHLELRTVRSLSKSYIDDTEILLQRKKTTAFEWALSRSETTGGVSIDIRVANKRGVPWFGAQDEQDASTPEAPNPRYSLWTFRSSIAAPLTVFSQPVRYSLTLYGQTTNDSLYGSEHFSIGNRYTVRGFDGEQTLAAECGWYLQNELAVPLKIGPELYLGLDYGQVQGPAVQYLAGNSLAGSVLGLRGAALGAHYDLFAGWPLSKPKEFETAHTTYGFQLVYQL